MARAIMVSEEVYLKLTQLKREGESYSKVIHKFIHPPKPKKSFMAFAGAWSLLGTDETREIERVAKKVRKNWRPVPAW